MIAARTDTICKHVSSRQCFIAWPKLPAFVLAVLLTSAAAAQSNSSPAAPSTPQTSSQNTPEISSHEETTTFKVKVNLVEVRVVVRDAKGKAVGNLKPQDFQLLDNGKPQVISKFSVEQTGGKPTLRAENATQPSGENAAQPPATVSVPDRYIAYVFDDIHLQFPDLAQARNAAARQLQSLQPTDRAAIYTTSGQTRLDFTDDRSQLIATLNRIQPRSLTNTGLTPCPNISYYLADAIVNRNDTQALQIVTADAVNCGAVVASSVGVSASAQAQVYGFARRELTFGDQEIRLSLGVLQDVIRHLATMPGQRTVILVSPGFMNINELRMESQIAERALHSDIVINALDAQGLYTNMPDASEQRSPSPAIAPNMLLYRTAEQQANRDVMADLADTTGGIFFHNNNDLEEGFHRLAGQPEFSYLLGFAPQNLKLDGNYHKLKVNLKPPAEGTIQARKGYYAPKEAIDASAQARQAIEDAVFSQEDVREIPVELHTQFFKPDENDAKLSVLVRMDVRHLHFRKADGRNNNDVTVVSALFDRNGNFISGSQKVLQMHLKDETLEGRLNSGITLKSSFDVKPGSYIVRLVVRDEDGQLAAQSSAVEIP
jgi:VWFA-related protein